LPLKVMMASTTRDLAQAVGVAGSCTLLVILPIKSDFEVYTQGWVEISSDGRTEQPGMLRRRSGNGDE